MKRLIILLFALVALFFGAQMVKADVVLNETNFPDVAFRSYVSSLTGVSVGGTISDSKLQAVTEINVDNKKIYDLKGIEYFTKLTTLYCSKNKFSSIDVSKNTELLYFICSNNNLTSIDVSKNTKLYRFYCVSNQITSLDVSKNVHLVYFSCDNNKLTSIDVSKNTALGLFSCKENQLTFLDLTKNTNLWELACYDNQLASLNLANNTQLKTLKCYSNQLTSLDLTNNTALEFLQCYDNKLTSLNLANNILMTDLYCYDNQLTSLDLSTCKVQKLYCQRNSLITLKLNPNNTGLKYLDCSQNKLRYIDLNNERGIEDLRCKQNNITSLSFLNCEMLDRLECNENELASLNLSNNTRLSFLRCSNNHLTHLKLENNSHLTVAEAYSQISTRRFQIMSYNSNVNNCWALQVGTTDASRIHYLKIDEEEKSVTMLPNNSDGWMVVSQDLKKIPKKVEYYFDTGNEIGGWMRVIVNYDIKNYGVFIDGKELTSLNFYDIPGHKSGTAYLLDEREVLGLGWSGNPTLVLNNARIEGEKGLYNESCYNFKIYARGDNNITASNYDGFDTDPVVRTTISGGGTLCFAATGQNWPGIYNADHATLEITDGTIVICNGAGFGFFDDCGRLYITENSALMAYGNQRASVELPAVEDRHFDSNIAIRYPVGATYGGKYGVYYANTTTDVQQDWVVIGPDTQRIRDLITGINEIDSPPNPTRNGGEIYNLAGQKVDGKYKGIVIKDGKKVLVK